MTGLEPHPILTLPTVAWHQELKARLGEEMADIQMQHYLAERVRRMRMEKEDPFNCGYEPEIWHLVDDLLVDGNTVILDVSRLEKLNSGPNARPMVDVPIEIACAPEVYIAGANRSSKSEYAAKKIMKVLTEQEGARTWSFADTGPISIARQQPIFWKYMPVEIKRLAANTGKARQGVVLNISYKQKTGFAEQSFVLPKGGQHWFKNYEQDIENVEGDQLDAIWLDELRNIELLRTLRGRMIDRGGFIIVTFTAIDENYTAVVNEYERGARTVFEVEAELLPIKRPKNLSGAQAWDRSHPGESSPEQSRITNRERNRFDAGSSVTSPAQNNLRGGVGSRHAAVAATDKPLSPSGGSSAPPPQNNLSGAVKAEQHSPATVEVLPINGALAAQKISAGNVAQSFTAKEPEEPGSPAETNFSRSTLSQPDKPGSHKQGMAATVEEGTAPKPVQVNAEANVRQSNSGNVKSGVTAGETAQFELIGYKKVPRIKVAGPGTDGNQRANIVYFHAMDNPYFGYEGSMQRRKEGRAPLFGKERFYRAYRNATEAKILSRVYGILTVSSAQQFPKFNDSVHVLAPERIPRLGTNYLIADPCDGRNWFMVWIRIDSQGRWFVYREWPSTGHPGAYIPGRGDPGPWALPGQPADGVRGPAQQPFGFGLERYIQEILRLEEGEKIQDRWMDSRYAANPTTTKEGSTTHIEQLSELGMEFLAASGKEIVEGTGLINDKLDYDQETELGKFSATLARLNEPKLFISRNCPNVIYSLREWTNKDKQHGACKDPVDVLRYGALAGLDYIGEDAYSWQGGGSY